MSKIQPFENVKFYKEMYGLPDAAEQKSGSVRQAIHFFVKFWHFQIAVSLLLLGLFKPNLGILWISMCCLDYVDW